MVSVCVLDVTDGETSRLGIIFLTCRSIGMSWVSASRL